MAPRGGVGAVAWSAAKYPPPESAKASKISVRPRPLLEGSAWKLTWTPSQLDCTSPIDDLLKDHPGWAPPTPNSRYRPPTVRRGQNRSPWSVIQALLGYTSESRRFIRHAHTHLRGLFPYLPQRAKNNKRLRVRRNHDPTRHRRGRPRLPQLHRRHMARGLHPRGMRPLPRNRQTLRHGRLRQLRLLRQPLPTVLGTPPPPHHHTLRTPRCVRPDQRKDRRNATPLSP